MKNIQYTFFKAVLGMGCFLLCLVDQSAFAQDISLTHDQLKAYEGVFQSQQNNDMKVQFKADSNSLQANLLWNGGRVRLFPKSTVDFYSKEGETVNIKFVKGEDGSYNQLSVDGNGLWERVKNYKIAVKKEFPHIPDQLKTFEGLYQFQGDSDRYIQLTVRDNQLILRQHWDGQEVPFVPDSSWDFFNKAQQIFTLHFVKGPDSNVLKVVAFKRDVWNKAPAMPYEPVQLKIFEGKYRLKDDPDDIVQIKAAGGNLVVIQLWDRKETILYPMAADYFYNAAQAYPAKFLKDDNGAVSMVLLLSGDLFEKIKE